MILELVGAAGFLLGLAVAALLTALATGMEWISDWHHQVLVFAVAGVLFTLAYWSLFRRFNQQSDVPLLNARARSMIGRRVALEQDLSGGQGQVQIGDTFWRIRADQSLQAGTLVEVVDTDGMTLLVRVCESS
ncbi:NfeD family protein [Marinobacterium arenosum]|uniref:NfeD family protein n=1 Tax=Marinobacterium arenosum TaxID=2862496 RepID=UPI001C97A436|nr:NfeD family protein [Marinobacterium arenosum]MBY4677118.1 NfeD family protein [Marinobacterium arenosum]